MSTEELVQKQLAWERRALRNDVGDFLGNAFLREAQRPDTQHGAMSDVIDLWLKVQRTKTAGRDPIPYPYIDLVDDSTLLVRITVKEVVDALSYAYEDSVGYRNVSVSIGRAVITVVRDRIANGADAKKVPVKNRGQRIRRIGGVEHAVPHCELDLALDNKEVLHIGTVLLDSFIHTSGLIDAKAPERKGTFKTIEFSAKGKALLKAVVGSSEESILPRFLPMLVEPFEHREDQPGGYFFNDDLDVPLIREYDHEQRKRQLMSPGIKNVRAAVNALQSVPWRICTEVAETYFELALEKGFLFEFSEKLDLVSEDYYEEWLEEEEFKENLKRVQERRRVELVRELTGYEFYFPHYADWRGRCYVACTPGLLSYQGGHVARGLIEFARGVEVCSWEDMQGVFVQAANTWGHGQDHLPVTEKVHVFRARLDEMASYGDKPLARRGWYEAEKPFQFSQVCVFLASFVRAGSTFPVRCHVPAESDGTCSAYQHYAAIVRSRRVGELVNMTATSVRNDIYTRVLELVKEDVVSSSDGWDQGYSRLTRAFVKDAVMTFVYGRVKKGRKQGMIDQYEELTLDPSFAALRGWGMGPLELHRKLEVAIPSVAADAISALKWLQSLTKARCTYFGNGIEAGTEWTSLVGMPVRQFYPLFQKKGYTKVSPILIPRNENGEERELSQNLFRRTGKTKRLKQGTAIAANFVHSQDASHMMLTAIEAKGRGMPFAAVHDSFVTAAPLLGELNQLLREVFVSMYQERNVLLELYEAQPAGVQELLEMPPQLGDLDVSGVRENEFFFH